MHDEQALVDAARGGDGAAFERLVAPHRRKLYALAYRMLAHPEDADDAVQDALVAALDKLDGFRGDAGFGTWLCAIVTRRCLNALRERKRWRWDAQRDLPGSYARDLHEDPRSPARDPGFRFEAREHIAFCLVCVGRSLAPEEQAALLLRDVFGHGNRDAAKMVGVTESVLRHALAGARARMQEAFEGLCSLVSKDGICYQCKGLRDKFPEAARGGEIPALREAGEPAGASLRRRLAVVREADLEDGASCAVHAEMLRRMTALEEGPRGGEATREPE